MKKCILLSLTIASGPLWANGDDAYVEYRTIATPIVIEARKSKGTDLLNSAIERFRTDEKAGNLYAGYFLAEVQHELGERYRTGEGVDKDYREALRLFEESASRDYAFAVSDLAMMHAAGQGTAVSYSRALEVLIDAGLDESDPWRKMIEPTAKCGGTTTLHKQPLKCIHRAFMHKGLEEAGLHTLQHGFEYRADTYDTKKQMPGSDRLEIFYTNGLRLGFARYVFPSSEDVEQVVRVKELAQARYGEPAEVTGNPDIGPVSFRWVQQDGVELEVSRGWPDTTTFMTYYVPEYYTILRRELDAQHESKQNAVSEDVF